MLGKSPSLRWQVLLIGCVIGSVAGSVLLALGYLADAVYPFLWPELAPFRGTTLALAAALLVCLAYGYWIERRWIELTYTTLSMANLPAGAQPIRIVHLSDLHCTAEDTLERGLPDRIHLLDPDLIVLTGDYLGRSGGRQNLRMLLTSLKCRYGVYAVLGNHDLEDSFPQDVFDHLPISLLNNEIKRISIRDCDICLVGLYPQPDSKGVEILNGLRPTSLNILLHHYPDLMDRLGGRPVDLMLSGHTHGGQVAVPGFGAIVTLSKGWKRYERGLYHREGTFLYVNRGLGSYSGFLPPIRFFARPEVAVIDLVGPERRSE